MNIMSGLYSSSQVIKLLGISRRQILYWVETKLIESKISTQKSAKYFSFINLIECKVIKSLLEQGISMQAVRKTLNYLRKHYPELKNHLSEFKLITNGKDIFVIDKCGKGFKTPSGQLVMLIPFGDYYKEVTALLKKEAVKPAIDTLKFLSDEDFWQDAKVIKHLESKIREESSSKSYSLNQVKQILLKNKQA